MDERSQVRAVKDAVSDTAQSVMDVAADVGAQAQGIGARRRTRDAGGRNRLRHLQRSTA